MIRLVLSSMLLAGMTITPHFKAFTFLASPTQSMFPGLAHFIPKGMHCIHIAQHSKVIPVSDNYRAEPTPHFRNRIMHTLHNLTTDRSTLCRESFSYRPAQDNIIAFSTLSANVSESQKIKCFKLSLTSLLAICLRKTTKFN